MDTQLTTRLGRVRANLQSIDQQLEYEAASIIRNTARIEQLEKEKAQLIKAVGVIDKCIQVISANGIGKIESMVTDGLQRVFTDSNVSLVIEKKDTARGNTYKIQVKDGETVANPMDAFGGGIQNVVAFLLRVILIKRFKLANFLILDEQFSNVSPEYQPKVAELLKTLAGLGFTIFAISHQPLITAGADNLYAVSLENGQPHLIKIETEADYERPIIEDQP